MTANLLNGGASVVHLAEVLDRVEPDLLVTQELGLDAAEKIASRFPHHDLHPALDHRGRGVAGRYPASFGSIDLRWRSGSWARMEIDGSTLVLATVHLINPVDFPWWSSVRKRQDQLDALFAWADRTVGEEPFVLAGDMNASPRWPGYRRLKERWDDLAVVAAQAQGTTPDPTWGWRPGWPRVLRIDHVFGSGVTPFATSVELVRGSDHAAVVVDLELG